MKDQDSSSDGIQSGGLRNASIVADASRAPAAHAPKGASRAAVALLEDFGRVLGLPSLHFGEDDCCWLNIGDEHITCIATFGDTGFLRLHGEVIELPLERDAQDVSGYFSDLLKRNLESMKREDAMPLAIDPRRNALVLMSTVPISATCLQLEDAMDALVAKLTTLKQNPPPLNGASGVHGSRPNTRELLADNGNIQSNAADTSGSLRNIARAIHRPAPPSAIAGEIVWRI